jgi:hypothetical protein
LTTKNPQKRLVIRWTTLRGLAAIVLFLLITVFVEYAVVAYAMNLGVQEKPESMIFGVISPLFHLVPAAVTVALVSSWTYLTRHAAIRPKEKLKGKAGPAMRQSRQGGLKKTLGRMKHGLLKAKSVAYVWQKIHFARATIKSAITVLLAFATIMFIVSLLAYPQAIYQTVLAAYQNNSSLLGFVQGTGQALASVGGVFSGINNALLSAAPGFRDFCIGVGNIIKPLADLDNTGKYLVFQNAAAWVSGLTVLFYGQYGQKGFRYKKSGKS